MSIKNIYCLVFLLLPFILVGQHNTISGKIIDNNTQKPLTGANIFIPATKNGTTSDKDGDFRLSIKKATLSDSVIISFMGYSELRYTIQDALQISLFKLTPCALRSEEIIIYADREEIVNHEIVTTVSEITPVQIENFGTTEIAEIFKSVPAVNIEGNDLSGRSIQIWGSNPDEVNVYLDGILLNMLGIKNQADISIIPLNKISKINIYKGANQTLLGNGAFGGVVDIETKEKQNWGFNFKVGAGSYETKSLSSQVYLPITKKLILNYSVSNNRMKPEIEYYPGEKFSTKSRSDQIETEKTNHFVGLSYYRENGKLSGKFLNYNLNYKKSLWADDNDNYLFSFAFNGVKGKLANFDLYLNHFYNQQKTTRTLTALTQYLTTYYGNRSNIKIAKNIMLNKKNNFQLIGEYFHDEINSMMKIKDVNYNLTLNRTNIYDNRMAVGGVFTFKDQHETWPFISWNTFIGLREDFIASGENEFTKSFGAEVLIDKENNKTSVYCNYGSNVKFPTLLEKSYIETYSIYFPNSDTIKQKIKPEYVYSYQLGFENSYLPKNAIFTELKSNVVLFYNTIHNKLLKQQFNDIIYQTQMGRNVTKGVEASIKFSDIFNLFSLYNSYIITDISNKSLYAFKPEQAASIQMDLFIKKNFSFSGRCFYEGKSYGWYFDYNDDIQEYKLDPFYDFDISLIYKYNYHKLNLQMQLTGSNILDAAGYTYYYLKKRYWQFSVSIGI